MHATRTTRPSLWGSITLIAWLALPLAVFLLGCSKGSSDAEVVTVGAYFSLAGSDSTFGIDSREGIEMATEEVNKAGGVKGKNVRVLDTDGKWTTQVVSKLAHAGEAAFVEQGKRVWFYGWSAKPLYDGT